MYINSEYECASFSTSITVAIFGVGGREGGCWQYQFVSLNCLQTEYARFDGGRFVYRINRSPMCEYMVSFIHRLKHLPEKFMMNSVLENFTILQVCVSVCTYVYKYMYKCIGSMVKCAICSKPCLFG